MKFPIIKIRDKGSKGPGFLVGIDERHHELMVDENGNLEFLNVQCCDGTGVDGGFEFVAKKDDFGASIDWGNIWDLIDIAFSRYDILNDNCLKKDFAAAVKTLKCVFDKAEDMKIEHNKKFVNWLRISSDKKYMDIIEKKRLECKLTLRNFASLLEISPAEYCDYKFGRKHLPENIKNKLKSIIKLL